MEPLHMTLFLFAAVLALIVPLRRLLAGRLETRGRVWTAAVTIAVFAWVVTGLGSLGLGLYGWVLFLIQPLLMGALAEVLVTRGGATTDSMEGMGASALGLGVTCLAFLLVGLEGLV